MTELKLFVCMRGDSKWEGALLILAESKEEAERIFFEREECAVFRTCEVNLEKKGIFYDDYER